MRSRVIELFAALVLALAGLTLAAIASPTPTPAPAPVGTADPQALNNRLKATLQKNPPSKEPPTPTKPQHTELIVETNKKGYVTRVRASKGGPDPLFNAMVYGNALQAFIKTPSGEAIPGTYKLIYDYSPDTKLVRRTVELVSAGGVDPDAVSAVDDMAKANAHRMQVDEHIYEEALKRAKAKPSPKPTSTPRS